jgi:hypothetical protein
MLWGHRTCAVAASAALLLYHDLYSAEHCSATAPARTTSARPSHALTLAYARRCRGDARSITRIHRQCDSWDVVLLFVFTAPPPAGTSIHHIATSQEYLPAVLVG